MDFLFLNLLILLQYLSSICFLSLVSGGSFYKLANKKFLYLGCTFILIAFEMDKPEIQSMRERPLIVVMVMEGRGLGVVVCPIKPEIPLQREVFTPLILRNTSHKCRRNRKGRKSLSGGVGFLCWSDDSRTIASADLGHISSLYVLNDKTMKSFEDLRQWSSNNFAGEFPK